MTAGTPAAATAATAAAAAATAATLSRLLANRDRLAIAARAIEPLLNRVVFTGRQVAELLVTHPIAAVPRSSFASDSVLRVLSTASLDRVAVDLQRLGLRRGERTALGDRWAVDDGITLELTWVSGDESDPSAIWLEYASLLTMAIDAGHGLSARISGAPALLALDWAAFRASGESALDSGEVEDIIVLAAGRAEVVREVAAAPPELRSFVAAETRRFLECDAAGHVMRCAIPGARQLPALADRAAERLWRIAMAG
jgi:hypothetical protein